MGKKQKQSVDAFTAALNEMSLPQNIEARSQSATARQKLVASFQTRTPPQPRAPISTSTSTPKASSPPAPKKDPFTVALARQSGATGPSTQAKRELQASLNLGATSALKERVTAVGKESAPAGPETSRKNHKRP